MRNLHLGTLLLLLVCATSVKAEYAPINWDTTGVPVRQGFEIEWQRSAEMDTQGNVVYVWSDTRLGDRDVYAQRISPSGVKTWGDEDGLQIVHFQDRQEDPSVIATGFGTYLFIWNDFRYDTAKGDMYAQLVNSSGVRLWNPEGVLVTTGDFDSPAEFRLVPDGAGGAVIIWNDLRYNNADIFAARVDANGTQLWESNGMAVITSSASQAQISVDTDGQGGAIVAWMDNSMPGGTGTNVFIQHLTNSGTLAWGASGMAICDTMGDQNSPKICKDGSGGAFMVWEDKRFDQDNDLYFQHISASGQIISTAPEGLSVVSLVRRQEEPRLVNTEPGQAIIIWMDSYDDPMNFIYDVYAQKVNSDGQKLWAPQNRGVAVCNEVSNQSQARLYADGIGNAICVWMDQRNGNENLTDNIYAQKINGVGSMGWTNNGVVVCDTVGLQSDPLIRAMSDYSLISWFDDRSGSPGIWYQKLNVTGGQQLGSTGDTLVWGIAHNSTSPVVVRNNNGKMFVFFEDERDGSALGRTVFFQLVDTLGNLILQPNGKRLCPDPVFTVSRGQMKPDACSDMGSGAIAIWLDSRDSNPYYRIYAQRVNGSGNLQWNGAGMAISPIDQTAFEQVRPRIITDGSGGGIVAWTATPPGEFANNVYLTKVSPAGSLAWPVLAISTSIGLDEFLDDLYPDGSGGAYVSYSDGAWPNQSIYGQHVSSTGSLLWGEGVLLCADPAIQVHSRVISLGAEGAVFVWEDQRSGFNTDLYAQKVNSDGLIQWGTNGMPVCTASEDQLNPDMAVDAFNNVSIVWTDTRADTATSWNIYMQKIAADGQILFPLNGMTVTTAPYQQAKPKIMADGWGGNYILWEDSRNGASSGNNVDVFSNHINSDGSLSVWGEWTTVGNAVCTEIRNQGFIVMTDDFVGGVMTAWVDQRSSGKATIDNIYAQRFNEHADTAGVIDPEFRTPEQFRLLTAYPNPFNPAVKLRFSLNHPGRVTISAWDVMGRQVAVLADGWRQAGLNEMTWDGSDMASGIYLVRLEFDGAQQQQKVVLLK
jgi:hypothetical protein